ncbi:MAG: S8 family serine peptidase [Hyphomicrobiaceae bacterium]|nr:S8 family serine peptidase [Hyphomicrobiaceae bacterium]
MRALLLATVLLALAVSGTLAQVRVPPVVNPVLVAPTTPITTIRIPPTTTTPPANTPPTTNPIIVTPPTNLPPPQQSGNPNRPNKNQNTNRPTPTTTVPVTPQVTEPATPPARQIVYRRVPLPLPRPELREVPYPVARPLLTLGRAAIIDAPFEPQTLVVMVPRRDAGALLSALMAEYGFEFVDAAPLDVLGVSLAKLRLPDGLDPAEATWLLAADPRVSSVQPNYLFEVADGESRDVMRALQYAPQKMDLPDAHLISTGEGITIGLIDTAVDPAQPELTGTLRDRLDVLGGDPVSLDHGTAMGGLITAHDLLDGIAPDVKLLSVRAFDADTSGKVTSNSFALAEAIDKAIGEGADLLNFSFAGPRDPLVLKVVDQLEAMDVPIIAAAGNNGPDAPPVYPAAHRHAIAVTATDNKDEAFFGANLGMYVEIAAPGVDILSPAPEDRYRLETGTSVATAHVSGIAALVLAVKPGLSTAGLRAILEEACRDLGLPGRDEVYGAGLIDAAKAVELAAS